MKDIIEFYYNIRISKLHNKNNSYFFNIQNKVFTLKPYQDDPSKVESIYRLNMFLEERINIDQIILNKYESPLTVIESSPYILIEKRRDSFLSLPSISNLSNIDVSFSTYFKDLERNNWETLWANKIDYYEMYIGENKKKYPLIRESFDYFVGMGENAISYLVNTKLEVKPNNYDSKVPSHNNLYSSLYDPVNIILDHKARDIAEYIKYTFWNNTNENIFISLDEYFKHNPFSVYGIRVLFSRVLYPSFYFNLYDQIITERREEKDLNLIINRISEYEYYLSSIYYYLQKYYDIPKIEWLKK